MAERRMFSKKIVDSDAFLDMPLSTQALYFHLSMRADDDGFINNPRKIQRMVGCSDDDIKLLIAKRFVLGFDSGVIVIKHWRIHNYISKDRYHKTDYQDELSALMLKPNGAYTDRKALPESTSTDCIQVVDSLYTGCIQDVYKMETEVRLGKDSIDKVSINIDSDESEAVSVPKKKGIFQEFAAGDKALLDALREYNEYRNKKKKPLTDGAKTRLCKRLVSMFGEDHKEMVSAIYYAIDKGWMDIYKPKEQAKTQTQVQADSVSDAQTMENMRRFLESLKD